MYLRLQISTGRIARKYAIRSEARIRRARKRRDLDGNEQRMKFVSDNEIQGSREDRVDPFDRRPLAGFLWLAPSLIRFSDVEWFDLDENGGVLDVHDRAHGRTLSLFVLTLPARARASAWWEADDGHVLGEARIGVA